VTNPGGLTLVALVLCLAACHPRPLIAEPSLLPETFPSAALVDGMCDVTERPTEEAMTAIAGGRIPGVRLGALFEAHRDEGMDVRRYRGEGDFAFRGEVSMAVVADRVVAILLYIHADWLPEVKVRLERLAGRTFADFPSSTHGLVIKKLDRGYHALLLVEETGERRVAAFGCETTPLHERRDSSADAPTTAPALP